MGVIVPAKLPLDPWDWYRFRLIAYGESGGCKTPFGTRLPKQMFPALYLAYDPTSKTLESVLPEDRDQLVTYVPDKVRLPIFNNPLEEALMLSRADWATWGSGTRELLGQEAYEYFKGRFPEGLKTIVLDGCTHMAETFFEWEQEHLTNKDGKPVEDNRQYYNEAQKQVNTIFTMMEGSHCYSHNPPKRGLHLIWLAQVGEFGKDNDRKRGPQTVGRQGPVMLPHRFTTTLYLSRMRDPLHNPEGHLRVLMEPEFPYIATVKKADTEDNGKPKAPKEMFVKNTHRAFEEVYEYLIRVKSEETVARLQKTGVAL